MKYNLNNPATIASLLNDTPKPVFLLGAGASITSGIPLAAEVVNKAAKWAFARQNGKDPLDPRITKSDWYPWLETQHWFNPEVYLADLFPYAVEYLLQPQKVRKEFWINILNPDVPISVGYLRLVELMHLRKVNNVLTTNFDECIGKARNIINRPHHIDIIKSPDDYTKISSSPQYPCLIYLHGAIENYTDKNVIEEVSQMDDKLVQNLTPILKDCPLVVIGYRGSESSVMEHLLLNNAQNAFNYKNGIYWCIRRGEKPEDVSPKVKLLAQAIGSNFQFVEIESFDHLLEKVIGAHLEEERIILPEQPVIHQQNGKEPRNFDLRSVKVYTEEDLDKSLVRERITNYCEKLKISIPEKISELWLLNQMINLNLVNEKQSQQYITNAGVLLFHKEPQLYIKYAKIVIRFIGEREWLRLIFNDENIESSVVEREIQGNLWSQLNQLNEALALVNRPFRLKNEKSVTVLPYDSIALKEIIVNSIVHRDYEIDSPNIIEIYQDRIVVKNPGGLMEEVRPFYEDSVMYEEILRGRRGIKGYRNPALADLFYSSGDMDKKGSGLYDVVVRVQANAGFVEFSPNEENSQFVVTLCCRPEAIDTVTNTASPLTVISTKFFTNIIEIKNLPRRVYFSQFLYGSVLEMFERHGDVTFPPFLLREKKIYSFWDLSNRSNPLKNVISADGIDSLAMDEFLGSPEGEKNFVWLLNDYLKSFFQKKGLIVDITKKRAYFPRKVEVEERTISYQARFKKATRTVVKPKYSINKERIRYWEHKGFNFSIKKFGEDWGLLIEPTYIFTLDGYKRLFAPLKVGALATKKASRDYNKNVLNDITFWMWLFSSTNGETFNLGFDSEGKNDEIILSSEYVKASVNYIETSDLDAQEIDNVEDFEIDEELAQLADEEIANETNQENEN